MTNIDLKDTVKIMGIGILTITLLDTTGSIASRYLNFNYAYLAMISALIYGLFSFIITKKTNKVTGIMSAIILGIYDSTVGWTLSNLLEANAGNIKIELSPITIISTIIFVVILSSVCGLIGALCAGRAARTRSSNLL